MSSNFGGDKDSFSIKLVSSVDPGEQSTGLLTEDETNQYQEGGEEEEKRIVDEKERKDNKINYERILLQLQIMEDKKIHES